MTEGRFKVVSRVKSLCDLRHDYKIHVEHKTFHSDDWVILCWNKIERRRSPIDE